MSKFAIISDIHANLEALEAVFAHIDEQADIEKIYCLGDVVGYGPNPTEVIDLVDSRCEWTLLGNHDFAMLHSPAGFNQIAAGAIRCQRMELGPTDEECEAGIFVSIDKQRRWEFLENLPRTMEMNGDLFVHASPREPVTEYILPQDTMTNPGKIRDIFSHFQQRCYVGHTHLPGVFTENLKFYLPQDIDMEYKFEPGQRAVLNVSSVGQPRDRDPRACYATITEEKVCWHRVEYDVEKTIEKVKEKQCLDDRCGLRLREGR